ncbi:translocation protein [Acaromyces ingoldii]|uniref:Translocation protein SEC62 n=1 Tax=Acaromyces ingoldii TaxID=215250 RepID=A0A316YSR4_9BASI|nr:translocation protein [Acaromyces ingoldii]PWN91708.1 translocation protein [Acaromyces ingoldii]
MENQSSAPASARQIVNFLRSSNGPKTKQGVLNGKRHDYFKGTGAVKALLSPAYQKAASAKKSELPKVTTEEEATTVLHSVIPYAFFLRVDRGEGTSKEGKPLQVNQMQMFKDEYYYAWFYEGSQLLLQLSGVGMILLMLAGVMFPLWPASMRVGVWYLSIGLLGLIGAFFGLAIVRLILWGITTLTMRPGIWIFPNLFEDVGFVDSFIPLWAWDVPPPKKGKKAKAIAQKPANGEKSQGQTAVANLPGSENRPQAPAVPKSAGESQPTAPSSQAAKAPASQQGPSEPPRESEGLADLD